MTIDFQCDGCGNAFHVPETLAGTTARCNRCGTIVTIPVPGLSFEPGLQAHAAPRTASYSPYSQAVAKPMKPGVAVSSGMPPAAWWAIGVVGCVAALVVVGLGLKAMFSGSNSSPAVVQNASGNVADGQSIEWAPSAASPPAAQPPRGFAPQPTAVGPAFAPAGNAQASAGTDPFGDEALEEEAKGNAAAAEPAKAKEESPARPTAPAASGPNAPDSGAPAADWSEGGGELRIGFDEQQGVTFGPLGCPVVVVGNEVWHLPTNRHVQTLEGEYEQRAMTALSADGQWFAAASKTPNQEDTAVQVWKTTTGEKDFLAPGDPEHFADMIEFTRNKYLLVGGRNSTEVSVWDVETGENARSLKFPGNRLEKGKIAFTPDGQYYAAVADKQLVVLKTATGKLAATMGPPLSMERAPGAAAAPRRADPSDAVFVYAWLQDLEFSPDAKELAGISTHPRPRLLVWDSRGKLTLDEPLDQLPTKSMAFWEHDLQWLPDKSGWVISGGVFDRATKRIVLGVRKAFAQELRMHVLDRDRLCGAFPHSPGELTAIQIPWDRINASLKAMDDGSPALLSPSAPVSINIQLSGTRGDQQESARAIGDSLVQRLARDGVRVERGKTTSFQVKFAETAGDQLPIYERQSPFDFRGHDTGRKATEAKGSLVIELVAEGESQPLWRDTIAATNSSSFNSEINDVTVRKSMLDNVAREINELNIPYFIPTSKDLLALPVVIE